MSKLNYHFYVIGPNSFLIRVFHNHHSVSKAMVTIRLAVAEWNDTHSTSLNWYELYDIHIPGVKMVRFHEDSIVVVDPGKSVVLL